MFVDPAEMRAGANISYNASWIAKQGAERFARTTPSAGIFGSFADAESFHQALGQAHTRHRHQMERHHAHLGTLGDKAHSAASTFADMDAQNAESLRAVWCNSST